MLEIKPTLETKFYAERTHTTVLQTTGAVSDSATASCFH
jgi:hypothetical protein